MAKYKVGDVAALFSTPKEPTTEAGKRLQSLFKEFHSNKIKSHAQSYQKTVKMENSIGGGNQETQNERVSKKSKKRKFSSVTSLESNTEDSNKKKFKKINEHDNTKSYKHSEKKKEYFTEQDFPRKKKASKIDTHFNNNSFYESDEATFSHIGEKSDAAIKSKNKKRDKKQASGFIRKSKQQNLTTANVTSKNQDSNDLSYKEASDDDTLFKDEVKEFVQKNAKKLKKKHNDDNFEQNSLSNHTVSNANFKRESNEKCAKISNKQPIRDTPLKHEVGDFIRNTKKLKKKNNSNFVQNTGEKVTWVDGEPNSEKSPFMKSEDIPLKHERGFIRNIKKLKNWDNRYDCLQNTGQKAFQVEKSDFIKLSDKKYKDEHYRTLFVGNLPVNTTKKDLRALFSPFGKIQDIRFHGFETDKAKIFSEDGSKSLNARNYAADSLPGFIVFEDRQSAIFALSLGGSLFKDHHITVDFALPIGTQKLYDCERSVFIGNLPFDIKDESVWDTFMECGRIENVRIVRDRQTGIGKGFGYVQFSTSEAKDSALALADLKIEGRSIRIKPVVSSQNKTKSTFPVKKDTFKSKAIKLKKKNKDSGSRKSVKKIMKKQKNLHEKKKVANILQKSMKS